MSAQGFTRPGALARALRRAGVSAAVATDAEALLRELDAAAYGPASNLERAAVDHALAIVRQTDVEALHRHELRLPRTLVLVLAAIPLGIATMRALQSDPARRDFERGVRAYNAREFDAARGAFALEGLLGLASAADPPAAASAIRSPAARPAACKDDERRILYRL